MKAVIMAGGEGSRLRPLTCTVPKPMVKLCGRPVSEYILDLLDSHGCTEAVFTLRYHGTQIENYFGSGQYKNIALDFSYEDMPLGTAGCVKKAASGFTEDFVVISGDAMCDFDISAAIGYHKEKKAAVTVITKKVSDPREYGCVISKDGFIEAFSEKPSYVSAVSDLVNTGIYILSPDVLSLISDGTEQDFSKDVFPKMLQSKTPLAAYEENGYWCDIGDLTSYKNCQFDMLNGKVKCFFTNRAPDKAPFYGKQSAIAPKYIGENVKIGEGTVLEGNCVIGDNVSIGRSCKLVNCVVLDGATFSDYAKCVGGIVCENAVLKQGSAVYENAVLGSGSVLGRYGTLEPKVKVWDNKKIPDETVQRLDVKYGISDEKEFDEKGIRGATNTDITPAFMTVLGSSAAAVFGDKVIVSCGMGNAASVLKACFCAGFSGAGGRVIDCGIASLPALIHLSRVMNAGGLVNIEAESESTITVLNKAGLPLTRVQERKLEAALKRGDYRNAQWDGFGEIKSFKNCAMLYAGAIENVSDFSCRYNVRVSCNNPLVSAAAAAPARRISNRSGEPLTIKISRDGTRSELFVSEKEKAGFTKLVTIVARDAMEKNCDVAVPLEFPSGVEEAARQTGRKVYRYYQCPNDNSDSKARLIASAQPFLFDGLILALNALEIISASYMSLGQYLETMPELATENRFLRIHCPPQRILGKLAEEAGGVSEGVFLGDEGNRVLLRSNRRGDGIFMFAESYSEETAKALCDNVEEKVRRLLSEV